MAGKVKIRVVSDWSIAATIGLALLCIFTTAFGLSQYAVLRSAMQDYIACEEAVHMLQEGSDNLTKQARMAAATGETAYINAYFVEADVTQSREKALEELAELDDSADAIAALQQALDASVELMQTEYYAMRLVEESSGTSSAAWPEALRTVSLSDEDAALSSADKLKKAQQLMIDPSYENAKTTITDDVQLAVDALREKIGQRQNHAADVVSDVLKKIVLCVLIFAVMMLLIGFIMRHWVVKPLLEYDRDIRKDVLLNVRGANELQMLAKTYNELYQENEERERLMKHQAEHDPLTGLLNRGSFDRILDMYERDHRDFALILIDVDTFKSVNDTCGHAAGDVILKKVAGLLTTAFRTIDYVCRIGGDEFAIIMVEMTSELSYTITDKITEVNRQLAEAEGDIPAVSLSVGVAFTDRPNPGKSLFTDADNALYYTKEHGRHGCSFYPVEQK